MPGLFDSKNFNSEVFGSYVDTVPNLNRNELLKSGAIKERQDIVTAFQDQVGGNYATIPIYGRIGGAVQNYDGSTDITATSMKTYIQGRVVVGRANAWVEKDFSYDITGGVDFMAQVGNQVAEYWDDVDQATLLAVLQGIFAMTGAKNLEFVNNHTYDITDKVAELDQKFGATTLNNAMQKALGDNKAKFSLAIMHSAVATNLENLKLLEYMKYTDANGIERQLALATLNGRMVLIDDGMPTIEVPASYAKSSSSVTGALEVVLDTATPTASQIKLGNVTPVVSGYTPVVGDYVILEDAYTEFTSYVLADGSIEYTNCGAKVPYETHRDPKSNGGQDTLYGRQRKIFSPMGISFTNTAIISPTDAQLETGSNWSLANSNESVKDYYPHKAIGIARVISRG
jgi:hypothetical protein